MSYLIVLKRCCFFHLFPFISILYVHTGSLRYDTSEMEAESGHTRHGSTDPVFLLYYAVRGARSVQGKLLSEPFLQLPSRREHPNYYQLIKQPISLQQIRYSGHDLREEIFSVEYFWMFSDNKRYIRKGRYKP